VWDWASFASGLVGAVLGSGVCGLTALAFLRRSNRREGRLRAIESINEEARELSRVREDHPPEGSVALQPETLRQMSRATAAVSALSAGLPARDTAVTTWAMGKLVALANAETPVQRFGLVTVLNSTLAGWAAGRIDTAWFEKENRAAEESSASAATAGEAASGRTGPAPVAVRTPAASDDGGATLPASERRRGSSSTT
jgi:hypothetical protein